MRDTAFYETSAQVIPTLLIVWVLEARRTVLEPPGGYSPSQRFPWRIWLALMMLFLAATAVGEVVAIVATVGPASDVPEWFEDVVSLAIAIQIALILVIGFKTFRQVAREQVAREQREPPEMPAASQRPGRPSLLSLVIVYLLVRRRG